MDDVRCAGSAGRVVLTHQSPAANRVLQQKCLGFFSTRYRTRCLRFKVALKLFQRALEPKGSRALEHKPPSVALVATAAAATVAGIAIAVARVAVAVAGVAAAVAGVDIAAAV